jgi:DNA-binding IscR family transcriptional regulator
VFHALDELFGVSVGAGAGGCAVEEAWLSAGAAMQGVMERTSLAALVKRKSDLEQHEIVRLLRSASDP